MITIHNTPHSDNTKPADVTVAPFHLPVSWSTDTNLCVCEKCWETLLALLCLNCTAAMWGKCLCSYYYSGPAPHFPSLCLQYSQTTTVPGGRRLGNYCTLQLCRSRTAYIMLHWTWGPACGEHHSPANKKYIKDLTHLTHTLLCYCWNNCSGGDDAWRAMLSDIMWVVHFILASSRWLKQRNHKMDKKKTYKGEHL